MTVPRLTYQIIKEAAKYVTPENACIETSSNKGNCVNTLKCYFAGKEDLCSSAQIGNEAYCALGSWAWVDQACKKLGIENILPKTKGARNMLNLSKNVPKLRVDKQPVPGAVFYRLPVASGSTGHIGTVVRVDDKNFYTIESNTGFYIGRKYYEGVWYKTHALSDIPHDGYEFIHTELMGGESDMVNMTYDGDVKFMDAQTNVSIPITSNALFFPVALAVAGFVGYRYITKGKIF